MAMSSGGGGAGVQSTPNVTPMVDVMLVLLIIFMVVAPALLAGFNAEPPQAQNIKDHPEDDQTDQVLGIDKDGNYYLNKKQIRQEDVAAALKHIYVDTPRDDYIMYLKADKNLDYSQGARRARHRDAQRRARRRHDRRPEAGHRVHGRRATPSAMPDRPARRRRHREERNNVNVQLVAAPGSRNEINVTPMIDVLLVLLIIFMAVLPSMRKAIDIQLPDPNPTVQPANENSIRSCSRSARAESTRSTARQVTRDRAARRG